jgi:predicted RNase H-like nuclease (RuvC/YqgF family)
LREKLFKIKCLEKEGKVDAAKELEKELMDKIEEIENLLKIGKGEVKKFEKEYNDG